MIELHKNRALVPLLLSEKLGQGQGDKQKVIVQIKKFICTITPIVKYTEIYQVILLVYSSNKVSCI